MSHMNKSIFFLIRAIVQINLIKIAGIKKKISFRNLLVKIR